MGRIATLLVAQAGTNRAAGWREVLAGLGHTLAGCLGSPEAAVEFCRATPVDLLLLAADLTGPGDIVETACWLRAQTGRPALLILPDVRPASLEIAARSHALGCVTEPPVPAQLQATLAAALAAPRDGLMEKLTRQISASQTMGVLIARPEPPDYPIVHVNAQFERITGYQAAEVIGRSPRFLHGANTSPAALRVIKEAVRQRRSCEVVLLNYRKDGAPFWNGFSLLPLHDAAGTVTHLVGRVMDVSELVAQKQALEASEARLHEAQRIARLGHWEWQPAAGIVRCSEEFRQLCGLEAQDLPVDFDGLLRLVHPEDRIRLAQGLVAAAADGTAFEADHRIVRSDGRVRHLHTRGEAVRADGGAPGRMVGTVQDITERQLARAELAMLVSQLQATFEATADGIVVVDRDRQIVRYNRRFVEVARLTPEQQHIRDVRALRTELFQDLKYPGEVETRTRALFEQPEAEHRDRLEFKDGRVLERHIRPQRVHGEIIGRVISFRDITELVRAEERLAGILEIADDAIITVDEAQRIVMFNQGAERVFGYSAEEIRGQPLDRLIPEALRAAHRAHVGRFGSGPDNARPMSQRQVDITGVRADGEVFPAEVSISRLRLGDKMLFTAILRDITARRKAEEARARLEAELRQAHKMEALGTFAGGVAHDFNNILTGIAGHAAIAAMEAPANSTMQQSLKAIQQASRRAADLVGQILAFSRKQESRLRRLPLNGVVHEAAQLLRASLPPSITLALELEPGAPDLLLDATQIHQALMNLCTNARDAVGPQGGRITLGTRTVEFAAGAPDLPPGTQSGTHVLLAVEDDGVGMDRATLERIFEPFFTTKGPGQGTGLGLAVLHGIVQNHGGGVRVHSEPGRGTRFELFFPVPTDTAAP